MKQLSIPYALTVSLGLSYFLLSGYQAWHFFKGCNDAYAEGKNLNACITGCDNARGEIDRIIQVRDSLIFIVEVILIDHNMLSQMGNHLLEEADKQMNFLNSIFDMMSSTFWNSDEGDSEEEDDSTINIMCTSQ